MATSRAEKSGGGSYSRHKCLLDDEGVPRRPVGRVKNATVYRGYDRPALDQQYNNLLKVPAAQLQAYRVRWAEESAAAKATIAHALDIPYGASNLETLDVFMPPGSGPWPVMVYIHGGYWRGGDKAECAYTARAFCRANILTVVINYGLVPATPIGEQVRHCAKAVRWVFDHIREYGGDPDQIFVTGHSAGGHLAAMLIAKPGGVPILPEGVIKGVCALSGIYDLEPILLSYLNESLHLSPADVAELSPVHHDRHRGVPIVFAVGALEGEEYLRQTQEIAARWSAGTGHVEVLVTGEDDHFSIRSGWDEPRNVIFNHILALMAPLAKASSRAVAAAAGKD